MLFNRSYLSCYFPSKNLQYMVITDHAVDNRVRDARVPPPMQWNLIRSKNRAPWQHQWISLVEGLFLVGKH